MENTQRGNGNSVKAVVFDLDGTLLDSLGDLASAVNHAMRTYNYKERTIDEVRTFVGNGIGALIRRALPEGTDDETVAEVLACFRAFYLEHCVDQTVPYDGIEHVLATLHARGIGMAIASNKLQPAVTSLAARFFGPYIHVAIGESATVRRKPAPDSILMALHQLGVTVDEALYVGDSEVDIRTAVAVGIRIVSATWGFRDRSTLEMLHPNALIDVPEDLLRFV